MTKDGNFVATKRDTVSYVLTDKTFTDAKGVVHPVYKSTRNNYFIYKTSKNGNKYKYYLKTNYNL